MAPWNSPMGTLSYPLPHGNPTPPAVTIADSSSELWGCWGPAGVTPTLPGEASGAETQGWPEEGCPRSAGGHSLAWQLLPRPLLDTHWAHCSRPTPGLGTVATAGLRLTLPLPLKLGVHGPVGRTRLIHHHCHPSCWRGPGKTAACLPAPSEVTSKAG